MRISVFDFQANQQTAELISQTWIQSLLKVMSYVLNII